jgi:glutamate/tyrosine decarboxylase-like PLP-dependent enzyme
MRKLLEDSAQRLESLDARSVAPLPKAVARLSALDEPMPEAPTPPEHVIEQLDETCSPATTAMAGPRFFGFVIGGSLPVTLAANWLAGAWDQNTGLYAPTPATARIEQVTLRWLLDLFGLPSECGGAFVTGATMANFSALAAARHAVLQKAGWNVEAEGQCGAPAIRVVVGAEAHPTIFKSLGFLGLYFRAMRSMASKLRSTSTSVVAQDDTLIRIAVRSCQTVTPHQQVPSV